MMELTSPYLLSLILVVPVVLFIMGFFTGKDKFPVEGRVRLKFALLTAR